MSKRVGLGRRSLFENLTKLDLGDVVVKEKPDHGEL
jgi:hypothetical protein